MMLLIMKTIIQKHYLSIGANGSRLGEVVDFEKLSLNFITNVK